MKSFQLTLFNSKEISKESRLVFEVGGGGEKAKPKPKKKEKKEKKQSLGERILGELQTLGKAYELKKKADSTIQKWDDLADKPGHTQEFKDKILGLIKPLKGKFDRIMKKGFKDKDVKAFKTQLASIEARAKVVVRAQEAKKKADTAKKAITEDAIKKQVTEKAKKIPAIQQLSGDLQATAINAIVNSYAGKIHKGIHKKIDGLVKALDKAKDVTAVSSLENQITNIYKVTVDKKTGVEMKSGISSPEIDNAYTLINEYAKSITIVLDASGQGFKDAGIDITKPGVKKVYDAWRTKLIGILRTGKAAPEDFIRQTKEAQTHIISASILTSLSKEKKDAMIKALVGAKLVAKNTKEITAEVFVKVLGQINIGYQSLESGDTKRTEALQAVAKLVQKYAGNIPGITMTIEGGADSETISYGKHTLGQLKSLKALAAKFASLPIKLQNIIAKKNPNIDVLQISAISGLSDKAEKGEKSSFVKFLEDANKDPNQKEQLFGAGGLFNVLLALKRAENIAGDIRNTEDKPNTKPPIKKSLFYQPNCNVFANAATGKVDAKDRRSRIGLELNIKVKGKVKMPKTPEQLATQEVQDKITKRKAGVLKRVTELGGKNIDDTLKIDTETTLASSNGNGGLDEADWAKSNQEYTRTTKSKGKTISFGISTSSPHRFTVSTKGMPKITCLNKVDLQETVSSIKDDIEYKSTMGELTIAQEEKVKERKKAVNEIIAKLGGKSMDKPMSISGLTFSLYTLQNNSGNWVVGDGSVTGTAIHKGKKISLVISMSEPHTIYTYDENGNQGTGINSPYKAKLEKQLNTITAQIDKKDTEKLIAERKEGVLAKLKTIPGREGSTIEDVEASNTEGKEAFLKNDRIMPFKTKHEGVEIKFFISVEPPHDIHVTDGFGENQPLEGTFSDYIKKEKETRPKLIAARKEGVKKKLGTAGFEGFDLFEHSFELGGVYFSFTKDRDTTEEHYDNLFAEGGLMSFRGTYRNATEETVDVEFSISTSPPHNISVSDKKGSITKNELKKYIQAQKATIDTSPDEAEATKNRELIATRKKGVETALKEAGAQKPTPQTVKIGEFTLTRPKNFTNKSWANGNDYVLTATHKGKKILCKVGTKPPYKVGLSIPTFGAEGTWGINKAVHTKLALQKAKDSIDARPTLVAIKNLVKKLGGTNFGTPFTVGSVTFSLDEPSSYNLLSRKDIVVKGMKGDKVVVLRISLKDPKKPKLYLTKKNNSGENLIADNDTKKSLEKNIKALLA